VGTAANLITLYVDDAKVAGVPSNNGDYDAMENTATDVVIGSWYISGSLTDFWPDKIDNVLIFSKCLTASEILTLYSTPVPLPPVEVSIDIKPQTCPNRLNTKSRGVLPIAILGSDDYDITTIDPTSIRLAGVEPLRSSYEDVATPIADGNDCTKNGSDGLLDLTLKFKIPLIIEAIGDVNNDDILTLELTGVLYNPTLERPIIGQDDILIKGKYKTHNKADINKDGIVDGFDFAIISDNWLTCIDCD